MGPSLLLPALLLLAPAAAAQEARGFRSLFDGKTLAGWSGDERFWSVEDGVLVGMSTEETPCRRSTYLLLDDEVFADCDLQLEFKILSGNSGVHFRSEEVGHHVLAGYQADLESGPTHTGALYEQFGRGILAGRGERALLPPQGAAQVQRFGDAAALGGVIRPGQWNRLRVLARGDRIRIEVNGTTTCDVTDRNSLWSRSHGRVGLQLHEGGPMRVEFKNLRVRDLGGERTRTPWTPPQWIWTAPEPEGEGEEAWFAREFELEAQPTLGRLLGSADDRMEVYLNGHMVALSETFEYRFELDVREFLRPGKNVLTVWTRNERDDAGLWLELRMRVPGRLERVYTDPRWRWTREPPRDLADPFESTGLERPERRWSGSTSLGPVGSSPWGMPRPSPRGAPQGALAAEELELPAGFVAELVYSVPQARLGSWVSLALDPNDPAGRLVASDQIGYLHRVTPGRDGRPPSSERLDVDLGAAHGLTFAFDALYVVVNDVTGRWQSGLWRLRDGDDDDRYESVELLWPFEGTGEHGAHAVLPGPEASGESGERWLYVVSGGVTPPPDGALQRARVVRGPDSLLPGAPDPNGHPPGASTSGGWVARTDPAGERWELLAVGLRNPYDLAFTPSGDLFTVDSDMEWDRGLPWYRSPRVLQIVSGADYGWRFGSGKWLDSFPDTLPSVLDIGPGSPTGMLHGSDLDFPAPYRDALFVGDWAFGRVQAIHLEPEGAGHRASLETFLRGSPLPVCDLAAGADGALYLVTGGRGLKSAVYRVRWEGEVEDPGAAQDEREPSAAVERRRALEALARSAGSAGTESSRRSLEEAWPSLASSDRHLQHAARVAVEAQPLELWRERALAERDPVVSLQAWLALAHSGDERLRGALLERLTAADWDGSSALGRRALLRVLDRALVNLGPPTAEERTLLLERFEPRFPSGDDGLDRALAELLIHLDAQSAPGKCLELMESASSLSEAIHYGFHLRLARAGWTPALRTAYFTWWRQALTEASGGESLRNYLVEARAEALSLLSDAERRDLGALAGPPPAVTAPQVDSGAFVRAWKRSEIEPRLGDLAAGRDLENGKQVFRRATCFDCHRVGDEGGSDGPDLTQAGARFRPLDLLDTILEPSSTISDQYRDTEVWTTSGAMHVGVVLREDERTLTLRTRAPESKTVTIEQVDVDERRPTELSRMPEGLLDTLELEDILDLFAYVLAERR